MAKNRLRVQANERVDLADFSSISGDHLFANLEEIFDNFACSPSRTRSWVIDGFTMSNPAGSQIQVDLGRAILAQRRDGAVKYGILATAGDSEKIVDLNTYPPGLYGVYVRFEEVQDSFQSRIFWNPAGVGSEYAQTIATAWAAQWGVRVELNLPGEEWMLIGTVDQATMTITDLRNFYFEGQTPYFLSGWSAEGGGSADDRDPDRGANGVTDVQMMTAALRQSIEDIRGRGLRRWWEKGIGGLNVGFDTDPTEGRIGIGHDTFPGLALNVMGAGADKKIWAHVADDTSYIFACFNDAFDDLNCVFRVDRTGYVPSPIYFYTNLAPQMSGLQQLGTDTEYWSKLYLSADADNGVGGDLVPTDNISFDLGNVLYQWQDAFQVNTRCDHIYGLNYTHIHINNNLYPNTSGVEKLGDTSNRFGEVWGVYVYAPSGFRAQKATDNGGVANYTTYTGYAFPFATGGAGVPKDVLCPATLFLAHDYSDKWIKIYIGAVAYWFPLWEEA